MFRNPTPTIISLLTAFIVAFVGSTVAFIISHKFNVAVFLFGIIALSSFVAVYYALEVFIYRKIKLIYKTIHDVKSHKKESPILKRIDLDADPIGEVNNEVMDWMTRSNKELEDLRNQEAFRREFLGNVSHELKTPIFNLQGYIHTLIDGAINDPEVNIKFLEKAAKSADRMGDLVQDLINISKLESGENQPEIEKFDINEMVHEIFDQIEMRAKNRGISLRVKDGCDEAFQVNADKSQIRQVLVNLIVNAVQYGKDNGQLTVGFYEMGEHILTEVADDGGGIDKEHLPRLFERFYRADKGRSRDEGGTGLGLSIVKHIIEAHQQTIHVRSTDGKGTTFGFTLDKA